MSIQENVYASVRSPLYSAGQVAAASFIGGPLGGGLLLRGNYRAMDNPGAGRMAVLCCVAATVLLGVAVYLLPADLPNSVLPAAYTAVMYQVTVRYQGVAYKEHMTAGGKQGSWLRAIGLGIAGLVVTLAAFFALYIALP